MTLTQQNSEHSFVLILTRPRSISTALDFRKLCDFDLIYTGVWRCSLVFVAVQGVGQVNASDYACLRRRVCTCAIKRWWACKRLCSEWERRKFVVSCHDIEGRAWRFHASTASCSSTRRTLQSFTACAASKKQRARVQELRMEIFTRAPRKTAALDAHRRATQFVLRIGQ
jgi:hypothetical protein